ncbi:GGDEF domain-containing protein [Pleurocapsa sp. PCC 7319]|uniref:GGDEF domain-containing protein n=1 Tax=Pleurocapsa sp. PCC 7319 TaxID=118161 RepID=UPI00036A62B5|nr:GGDEF domain-containing protein [Pleurocapsa sp. PCC 7319]
MGLKKTVLVVTILSILSSLIVAEIIVIICGKQLYLYNWIITIIIPAIVAPVMSYFQVKLIFEIDSLEKQVRKLVIYDQLTGAFNRSFFLERAKDIISTAKHENKWIYVIMMDLDKFKNINDRYGHQAGDLVLQKAGELCRKHLRKADYFGRYGGEEFILILKDCDQKEAIKVIERIRMSISNAQVEHENHNIIFTASFGISSSQIFADDPQENLSMLIKFADQALYEAKNNGRNCSVVYQYTK